MSFFRRVALVLALIPAAAHFAFAQDSSSSSNPAPQQQPQAQQPASTNQGAITVQQRIRARREQRRQQAIRDVYSHLYEAHTSMGYLRWNPGPGTAGHGQQRVTLYAWDAGFTRYYGQQLGITIDGPGYYGSPFVGPNHYSNSAITNPAISIYNVMAGPTYRFVTEPRWSVAGRVMGGYSRGNFSGDINGLDPTKLGLYADGGSFIISASAPLDYNLTPAFSLRIAPEFVTTGFGSTTQPSFGFTAGFVYRFGKQ